MPGVDAARDRCTGKRIKHVVDAGTSGRSGLDDRVPAGQPFGRAPDP